MVMCQRSMRSRSVFAAAAALCACAVAGSAQAQDRGWEIEGCAGLVAARTIGAGTWTIPPAGAGLVTSTPTFPTRAVSTWFFGDGAALLNGVNADFGIANRISPLETAVPLPSASHVATLGLRVRRRLSDRVHAEFSVDALARPDDKYDGVIAAVETVRASFVSGFNGLLATGPFSSADVSATGAALVAHRRDTALTGALNVRLGRWGAFAPYATGGAGVMIGSGGLPSATLEGHYRFSILSQVPIDERDRVAIHYTRGSSFVMVLGAGVRRDVSARWGWRADVRALFGPDTTRITIDAAPSNVRGVPTGFIESFTNPAIQFSNDPSTGRQSTLSGPPIANFEAFKGGSQSRTIVSIGVFARF